LSVSSNFLPRIAAVTVVVLFIKVYRNTSHTCAVLSKVKSTECSDGFGRNPKPSPWGK